jgi:Kef-type K+ transport system membrane component KefB
MSTAWLRLAYACEFLLAIIAVFALWSQVGGQGHLDLMPWYWKLSLGCGMSLATVGLTDAIATHAQIANRRSLVWAALILILATAMAAVTAYYHLHEPLDEPTLEEDTTARAILSSNC